jgi:hypothetical protein
MLVPRSPARHYLAITAAIFFVTMPSPAHAYIDPVTTSIVLQVLVGGVAAGLVAFRQFRDRVLGFFRRAPKSLEDSSKSDEK